jgi:hypothetical protein
LAIPADNEAQRIIDAEHLRLLALFHYISGALTSAFSLFFGVWMVFMAAMFAFIPPVPAGAGAAPASPHGPPFIVFAAVGVFFVLGLVYGVLEIVSGRFISLRRQRVFSLVVAVPRLLLIPYGMILSIFTLLVLERPSVKQLYGESNPADR